MLVVVPVDGGDSTTLRDCVDPIDGLDAPSSIRASARRVARVRSGGRGARAGRVSAFLLPASKRRAWRAAVSSHSLVAAGWRARDDWHGLLSVGRPDELAGRIAWLATDTRSPAGQWLSLGPATAATLAADPDVLARITPAGGSKAATACASTAGFRPLVQRSCALVIHARPGQPAAIQRIPAASNDASSALTRAAKLLGSSSASPTQLCWALGEVGRQWSARHAGAAAAWLGPGDDRVRSAAVSAVAEVGGAKYAPELAARYAAASEFPSQRSLIAAHLGNMGEAGASALARLAVREPDAGVRLDVIHALAATESPIAGRALRRAAASDPERSVRELATEYASRFVAEHD